MPVTYKTVNTDGLDIFYRDPGWTERPTVLFPLGFQTSSQTKSPDASGIRNVEGLSPDTWTADQYRLDRPGNKEIQLQLFYSYGANPRLYREWQAYFRDYQPPTLIVLGKNDHIVTPEGAGPYKRDLKNLEFRLLDTGPVLEEQRRDRALHEELRRQTGQETNDCLGSVA